MERCLSVELETGILYTFPMKRKLPDLALEKKLWEKGYIVIGIDEVGRGAFAGPLVVGGVVFPPTVNRKRITKLLSYGINDSKKLKPNARKMLSKVIQNESLAYHISKVEVGIINRFGIGKATFIAIRDVVKNLRKSLPNKKNFVLIDKFYVKHMRGIGLKNQKGIVHGDCISLSIAAASIVAKVHRDNLMKRLSKKYPDYNFSKNKGYGTVLHRKVIEKIGATELHRVAFVRKIV